MVSASCGAPVTVTGRSKRTSTSISSPIPNMAPFAGVLMIDAPLTDAAVNVPPATLWFAESAIARAPRPSTASRVPPDTLIAPPFRVSASAATPSPSGSVSPEATVYRNTSEAVPVPVA